MHSDVPELCGCFSNITGVRMIWIWRQEVFCINSSIQLERAADRARNLIMVQLRIRDVLKQGALASAVPRVPLINAAIPTATGGWGGKDQPDTAEAPKPGAGWIQ